jgi:hypothetical protein
MTAGNGEDADDLFLVTCAGYWGARAEDSGECSKRAVAFLRDIATIAPQFAEWKHLGRSRKDAEKRKLVVEEDSLELELLRGRNRRDADRSVIEDLGFNLRYWNGRPKAEACILSIHCGATFEPTPNCVVISSIYSSSISGEAAARMVASIANHWEPKWAGVFSDPAGNEFDYDLNTPLVDWMIYLQEAPKTVVKPAFVDPVDVRTGLCWSLSRSVPSNTDEVHRQRRCEVRGALGLSP